MSQGVEHWLKITGGRRACPHPPHRFAEVAKDCPGQLVLPECAGREQWLAARQHGIGGSEVGGLIGVNEHETAFSVFNNKMTGGKDLSDLPAVEWGHRLEAVVAEKTAEEIGLVSRFGGGLWAHREKSHLRVTPDRFATKPRSWKAVAVIECKTAGDDEHWESGTIRPNGHGTGSAPLGYQAQLQWQLGILGFEVGFLGCFHVDRSRQFFTVEVHFDKEWFAEMVHAADRLWFDNIKTGMPPMHDLRHPKTEELLKQINPTVVRPSVDLPENAEEWLIDYQRAKVAAEKANANLDAAKNFFRMWTGDAGAGYLVRPDKPDGVKVVGYPTVNSTRIDVEALRRDYPEVAEAVTVKSQHRRLTITVPKDLKARA